MSERGKSSEVLRAAALQLNSGEDVAANLSACAAQIRRAANWGAQLVVLPENFAYLGAESGKRSVAEALGDGDAPIQRALVGWAREYSVTLVAGGFPERSNDEKRPFNTCLVLDPRGRQIGSYRKIHLFDVELPDGQKLLESVANSAGDTPAVVEVGGFKLGLSICYDLRLPGTLSKARGRRCRHAVGSRGLHAANRQGSLARAAACSSHRGAVLGSGGGPVGTSPARSVLLRPCFDCRPWGTVVAEASDGVGVAVADLTRQLVQRVRTRLPSLQHRRLG